jgi:hypothetical protein
MANTDVNLQGVVKEIRAVCCPTSMTREDGRLRIAGGACAIARRHAGRCRRARQAAPPQHLLKQLGQRVTFELPPSLVDRVDRRLEEPPAG